MWDKCNYDHHRCATERICDQFKEVRTGMENYPYYPIQSICEQADFCKDGNTARLEVLKKSAEQHRTKYCVEHYNFIIEHITAIVEAINDGDRRDKAKRQIEDY